MLFKWKIESSGADSNRLNWTLLPYGIFFIIFLETIYVVTLNEKVDLGNNELPIVSGTPARARQKATAPRYRPDK